MKISKMIKIDQENSGDHIKLALYARVSTDAQAEEGYSIDFQKEKLTAYAKSMPTTPESIEYYIDDGYSGGSLDRPQMQKMIIDAEKHDITHVIVYKLDRLSRSQKDTLHLIEDIFIPNGIAFISISESFNTATPFGRAVIGILSVFAQLERENIYERTRNGMQKRVEDGYWMGGGVVPFGYDYDQNQGILVKNKDAEIVEQIYNLYLKGYSMQRIANMFNLKYDRLVSQILKRKSNTGVIIYKGKEYQGRHEPIISKEIYDKTMLAMQERSGKSQIGSNYLLTGLLVCGKCGAKMRYMKWGSVMKLICYSRVSTGRNYLIKDKNCDNKAIEAKVIEDIVVNDIFKITANIIHNEEQASEISSTASALESKLSDCNKKLERLYVLFSESNGDDDDTLLAKIKSLKQEKDNLQKQIDDEKVLVLLSDERMRKRDELKNLESMWPEMTMDEKRITLKALIKAIIITDDSVRIEYNI